MFYLKDEMERFKKSVIKHEQRWRSRYSPTKEEPGLALITFSFVLLLGGGYIGLLAYWVISSP